jgi:two-component system sensor histidine kinase BaeS
VRRVAEATRGLASSTTEPPLVPVEGARELALLAESFNEVAVALSKARAAERAFLLSVSHELKTPLTAIRGYAEGLSEGVLPAERPRRSSSASRAASSGSSVTCSTWGE